MTRQSMGSTEGGNDSSVESETIDADPDVRTSDSKPRPPSKRKNRPPSNVDWAHTNGTNGRIDHKTSTSKTLLDQASSLPASSATVGLAKRPLQVPLRRIGKYGSWSISFLGFFTALVGILMLSAILRSLVSRQIEPKGCRMSYMRPSYIRFEEFDTEHTRFATKYSLYLYREQGLDDPQKLHGIPVLFIPGNAGSYKQVRPIAAEAASHYYEHLQHDANLALAGLRNLDFFTVDFNEDITAFHGQTLLDQAEYLNEAVRYILSLYSDPQRTARDSDLPDPASVIIVGHSMGGVVARAMLVQSNYQANSINTVITMSAPHARPPVTFDGQIVQIYNEINEYWREAYAQKWASNNPLWHVTLVSIAGGSLDVVVPSDYASLESLVPETHGFTVFTTGIPTVWTSADHQAILWCDQFRKVVAQALFDVVDVYRASQTRPRAERMRIFRKRFLSGLEATSEKTALQNEANILLTLNDKTNNIVPSDGRLVMDKIGTDSEISAHLLTIPPRRSPDRNRFTLLSSTPPDSVGENGRLEVLLCSVLSSQSGVTGAQFARSISLSESVADSTRLACNSATDDLIMLPASTEFTEHPFYRDGEAEVQPFSYLRFELAHNSEFQFVVVLDKAESETSNFVLAEFSGPSQFRQTHDISLRDLIAFGLTLSLPESRPTSVEIVVPALKSSLLAYNLELSPSQCNSRQPLFARLVRQNLDGLSESKFFVNTRHASVSLHGVAPYMPPTAGRSADGGIGFEIWSDPTYETPFQVSLKLDLLGSMGKLYMRYRTVFAAFPLLIVTLVLRKQFRVYDSSGVFITFSESLDLSLRRSIPLLLISLTLLATSVGGAPYFRDGQMWNRTKALPSSAIDFHRNDLLIGTDDPFFTFLVPLIGIVCIGVCTLLHYAVLALTFTFSILFALLRRITVGDSGIEAHLAAPPNFGTSTPRRRMISTAVLLFLVATFIPYQFAYLVACLVQLFTTVRALRILTVSQSASNSNYYHYSHSILLLMMWVLPINLPILAVWVRNLAVHWLTPFSSHHNVLSIMPFILLVENLTTGRMVPQISSGLRHVTSVLLFCTALCAAIYGVSHAYMLHYLVNGIAAWLVVLHSSSNSWSLRGLRSMFEGNANETREQRKTP